VTSTNRFLFIVLAMCTVLPASAEEVIILDCTGSVEISGDPQGSYENLTVYIYPESKRLKVNWGGGLVIDDHMKVETNRYSYLKLHDDIDKVDRAFSINRTTLAYSWGIYMPKLKQFWTSEGTCHRIDPKI